MSKQDDFEIWLIEMDSALEGFLPTVAIEMKTGLDYSIDSLKVLELWVKQHYSTYEEIKDNTAHLDGCARYVGEVIRKQLGGKWHIELENDKDVFYGVPVVVGEGYGYECPLSMVTASLSRAKNDYIFSIVARM